MYLIVGLGNPGLKYFNNFHNMGYLAVDIFADRHNIIYKNSLRFKALIGETMVGGEKVVVVKPTTFMNLSGECVYRLMDYYKIPLKNLLVVYDDLDVQMAKIRIRPSGSAGTHNGMRNIVDLLGSTDFPRIRIGTKPTEELSVIPTIDYVLMDVPKEFREDYMKCFDHVADAIEDFIHGATIDQLMCKYNSK